MSDRALNTDNSSEYNSFISSLAAYNAETGDPREEGRKQAKQPLVGDMIVRVLKLQTTKVKRRFHNHRESKVPTSTTFKTLLRHYFNPW